MNARRASTLAKEAQSLGIDPPPSRAEDIGVWAANVPAVEAFLEVASQFNTVATAQGPLKVTGLNYTSARAAWEMGGVDITPDLFARVQMIEHGALAEWNKR